VVLRGEHRNGRAVRTPSRVMDRPDMQQMLFHVAPEDE
jgi:hypothetical protein